MDCGGQAGSGKEAGVCIFVIWCVMIQYFKDHKDSLAINIYLNGLPEDSHDFQIVYRLRMMGEQFVDGVLSMESVEDYAKYLPASSAAEEFIKQMKCWTFYTTLCHIAQNSSLSSFEQKVKCEIEHSTFLKPRPSGGLPLLWYKIQRVWYARWKHPLVFNEHLLPASITLFWCIIRMQKIVKD